MSFFARRAAFAPGVVRAIDAVEEALRLHGAPVYVRHEIVHNKYVVEGLKAKGADLRRGTGRGSRHDEAGDFFRAWRSEIDPRASLARNIFAIDATCPLVTKVHREAEIHYHSRPQGCSRRPCRTSRSRRHARAIAGRLDFSGPDRRGHRGAASWRTTSISPMSRRRRFRSTTRAPWSRR